MMTRRRPEGDYDDPLFSTGAPGEGAGRGDAPRAGSNAADDLKRAIEGLKEAAPGGIARLKQMIAREAFRKLGELGLGDGEVPLDVLERIRRGEDAMNAVRGYIDGTLVDRFGTEFVFDAVISRPDLQERIRSAIRAERERREREARERERREAERRERESREAEERERLRREAEERERERMERERRERVERERREAEARAAAEAARNKEWAERQPEVARQYEELRSLAVTHRLSLEPLNAAIRARDARRSSELLERLRKVIGIAELLSKRDTGITLGAYRRDFVQAVGDILRTDYRSWEFVDDSFVNEVYETYRQWQAWQKEFDAGQ